MLAAHAGHREVVETLIAHRANLNITAKCGLSALMLALIAAHAEVAHLLAKAGADLSLPASIVAIADDLATIRQPGEAGPSIPTCQRSPASVILQKALAKRGRPRMYH
jgi:ankyrin repeat protein